MATALFSKMWIILAGAYPQLPAAADVNGDGSVDLAVPNFYSNTVSVLLNLPVIAVSPNTVAFGSEAVGKKSKPHVITIGNPSGTPIGIHQHQGGGRRSGRFRRDQHLSRFARYAGARGDLLDCGDVYSRGDGKTQRQDRADGYRAGESAVHHADGQRHIG